ncbi:MAG: hypothetical protein M3O22_02245 [Pseudomonadota bacterium]|nr:hypothetical protein [Pseudomonadota bacterium]
MDVSIAALKRVGFSPDWGADPETVEKDIRPLRHDVARAKPAACLLKARAGMDRGNPRQAQVWLDEMDSSIQHLQDSKILYALAGILKMSTEDLASFRRAVAGASAQFREKTTRKTAESGTAASLRPAFCRTAARQCLKENNPLQAEHWLNEMDISIATLKNAGLAPGWDADPETVEKDIRTLRHAIARAKPAAFLVKARNSMNRGNARQASVWLHAMDQTCHALREANILCNPAEIPGMGPDRQLDDFRQGVEKTLKPEYLPAAASPAA